MKRRHEFYKEEVDLIVCRYYQYVLVDRTRVYDKINSRVYLHSIVHE